MSGVSVSVCGRGYARGGVWVDVCARGEVCVCVCVCVCVNIGNGKIMEVYIW